VNSNYFFDFFNFITIGINTNNNLKVIPMKTQPSLVRYPKDTLNLEIRYKQRKAKERLRKSRNSKKKQEYPRSPGINKEKMTHMRL
jgi:hypothetical protein